MIYFRSQFKINLLDLRTCPAPQLSLNTVTCSSEVLQFSLGDESRPITSVVTYTTKHTKHENISNLKWPVALREMILIEELNVFHHLRRKNKQARKYTQHTWRWGVMFCQGRVADRITSLYPLHYKMLTKYRVWNARTEM